MANAWPGRTVHSAQAAVMVLQTGGEREIGNAENDTRAVWLDLTGQHSAGVWACRQAVSKRLAMPRMTKGQRCVLSHRVACQLVTKSIIGRLSVACMHAFMHACIVSHAALRRHSKGNNKHSFRCVQGTSEHASNEKGWRTAGRRPAPSRILASVSHWNRCATSFSFFSDTMSSCSCTCSFARRSCTQPIPMLQSIL